MKNGLDNKIVSWLADNEGWKKKVELYVLGDVWGYSPETVGRALRRLANEQKILVDYYDGMYARHLAKYAALDTKKPEPIKPKIIKINGQYVAQI